MSSEAIPYGRQTIEEDDIQAVVQVLRSPFLTTGPKVKEFEQAIAAYVGTSEGVAFSSGTAGLHGALWAAGIGPGDEVLVPALSFLATANTVLYVGAKPVFVDSEPGGFNIDPLDAARKVTPATKAIIPVHFAGQPVDLHALHALAKKHHLIVIEDAAHALGAAYQGQRIGGLSDMTVFSFHPVKQITTAEGGMVMTGNPAFAKRLRQFRHHGIDVDVVQRDAAQRWHYDMTALGYNYRLSDLQCALGLSQLKRCERFLECREQIAQAYRNAFRDFTFLTQPPLPRSGDRHSWHLYIVKLNVAAIGLSRNDVFKALREREIGAHVHYRPIHLHSYYEKLGYRPGLCPVIEAAFPEMLTLPIFPGMTDPMVQRVIDTLSDVIKQAV
jgi:perosamine synthetase